MADKDHFDVLVSGLSLEERQNLLEKLKSQSMISYEPLYYEDDETVHVEDVETEYPKLPWYSRLWYFILSFIRSKAPIKIFEDHRVAVLSKKIEDKSPGLFDSKKGLLLPAFLRHMEKLKEAARLFYSTLDMSVNRDRGAFFAFLGSLEMPEVHRKLLYVTDPKFIMEKNPEIAEVELRQRALKSMDDAFAKITEANRNAMYINARSLNCLKELSSYLFDRVLMAFSSAANGETCSVGIVRDLLVNLNNILYSLKDIPSLPLLESVFVFLLQERIGEPEFDINQEIRAQLSKADKNISVIRDFNKRVPLTLILRCYTRDMSFRPFEISGGEDWYFSYRDYWKRRAESLYTDYMKSRRHEYLLNSFRYFLKGRNLRMLENTQTESNPEGMPVKGSFALSFLLSFYSVIFIPEINRIMQIILIDGDFTSGDNRVEFSVYYNYLIKLEDEIRKLENDISPEGDYGKRYAQAKQDMSSVQIKRRKIQNVCGEASEDALNIISGIRESSRGMINILNGILGRDSRAKYDSLTNLDMMVGKNDQFITRLDETIQQFQRVLTILDEIDVMETGH